jgi:DNA-directed RNA polymerase specialized sigma24 family protein
MVDRKDSGMRPSREGAETGLEHRGRRSEDVEGWHEIVRRFAPYVHAMCVAHGLTENAAEPVFHEVFTRIWTEIDRLENDDALRARVVGLTRDVVTESTQTAVPADTLRSLSEALNVHEAARGLPDSQRELLQRGVVEGQNEATIAEALDLGPDAVAEELQAARLRLRGRLRQRSVKFQGGQSMRHDRT